MCIIVAKEKHGRLPSEEELRNSFEWNSDGAGFMYVDNGYVTIDKGYMTWDSFYKHYKKLLKKYDNFKNKSLVMHFRIGTSGKNIKENTHPYPITNETRKLRAKHLTRENIGIVHNGIIKGYGTATGLNDTQEFISKYIYPIYSHFDKFYKNKDLMYGIEVITSSKWTILDKEDNLYFIGDFIDDKSLMFSNDTYRYYYRQGKYHYNYYDYYDEDWYQEFYKKQEEQKKEEKEYDSLLLLDKEWYIDLYGNGDTEKIGDRELYFDYETLELFEFKNGSMVLVTENPLIYDENYEEIW